MRTERVVDSAVLDVPAEYAPGGEHAADGTMYLAVMGEKLMDSQGLGDRVRKRVMVSQEWLITREADEIEAWPLPHDCDVCRAGKEAALTYATLHPGRFVALGKLVYDQHIYERGE